MSYRNLQACIADLQAAGHLVCVEDTVDARLEAAEIHRRVFASGGPAILFTNVANCRFPMVSNLFGTMDRARYIFRDTLDRVRRLVELKVDPRQLLRSPARYGRAALASRFLMPRFCRTGPAVRHRAAIYDLPHLQSWPDDGGAFITLPLVYTEDADRPGLRHSNLGMYRVQLSGGSYEPDRQIGLHYQIHRGIGIHHWSALRRGEPFRVNIFVGGAPAMTVAAVMPLPEGISELGFAGVLAGHRIPLIRQPGRLPIYAEADFCIQGTVEPDLLLPEGPFGDHLGYYSLAHPFPVLRVESVSHRPGAIWPFTVVGRPPQEDTMFGQLIHEISGPMIPSVVPGVSAVHAVDAAGVHPLMLAIGRERYTPFAPAAQPQELLTQANAILGQGQMSLAKYLLIVNGDDDPDLRIGDIAAFLRHVLQRAQWHRDLHFQTCTTIDTLDYSGKQLNQGSKLVIAAVGPVQHQLQTSLDSDMHLPDGFTDPRVCQPGVLGVRAPSFPASPDSRGGLRSFCAALELEHPINRFRLVVLTEDSQFLAASLNNFLWVTFTRSDPAADTDGVDAFVHEKHWGCHGALVIDARRKPHHAPMLEADPETVARVDARAARGGALARWL